MEQLTETFSAYIQIPQRTNCNSVDSAQYHVMVLNTLIWGFFKYLSNFKRKRMF